MLVFLRSWQLRRPLNTRSCRSFCRLPTPTQSCSFLLGSGVSLSAALCLCSEGNPVNPTRQMERCKLFHMSFWAPETMFGKKREAPLKIKKTNKLIANEMNVHSVIFSSISDLIPSLPARPAAQNQEASYW